jgi:hypothetical protein
MPSQALASGPNRGRMGTSLRAAATRWKRLRRQAWSIAPCTSLSRLDVSDTQSARRLRDLEHVGERELKARS